MLQFNHQLSLSFAFMHFFTAGVILCIPPARQPFTPLAQEAKAGIMRIILASRSLGSSSQIARHIDQLLTALLRITVIREMDNALQNQVPTQGLLGHSTHNPVWDHTTMPEHTSRQSVHDQGTNYPLNHPPLSSTDPTSTTAALPQQLLGQGDAQFNFDLAAFNDNAGIEFDTHIDEAFGSFGQMMFNILPDDPYTPWNWGGRSR